MVSCLDDLVTCRCRAQTVSKVQQSVGRVGLAFQQGARARYQLAFFPLLSFVWGPRLMSSMTQGAVISSHDMKPCSSWVVRYRVDASKSTPCEPEADEGRMRPKLPILFNALLLMGLGPSIVEK